MNGYKPFGPDWLLITIVVLAAVLAVIAVVMWMFRLTGVTYA
ncbi:hypothetical protein ACFVU2_21255 [Leifsonia sp. NPDC058194]